MTQIARISVILAVCLAVCPTLAWSQDDPDDEPDVAGDEVDMGEDPLPGDAPEGANENPDSVPEFGDRIQDGSVEVRKARTGYPIEVVFRPLTLASGMSEITLDLPTNVDPFALTGLLRARYGVTKQIQLGLAYGPGAVTEDGYTAGKTVAPEFHYLINDWISAQLSLPILLDPFAMGITIGAPMKFRFADKMAILFGQDLINIRLSRFVPFIDNPVANEAQVALDETGTTLDSGELRFLAAFIYQLEPNMAVMGEIGILARDFGSTDAGVPLSGRFIYSTSNKVDLGGRIGFGNLDDASGTFGATIFVALRI